MINHFSHNNLSSSNPDYTYDLSSLRNILAWISLLIILIGFVNNLVSAIAFLNRKRLSSTNIYLASLSLVDCIALMGLLLNSVIYGKAVNYQWQECIKLIMFLYPYVYPIIVTAQFASIYLTISVSINQFVFVAFSKGLGMINNRNLLKKDNNRARIIVLVIVIGSILFCSPYWLSFEFTNEKGLKKTAISQNILFSNIVHVYLYLPFAYILPFIVLIATNAYLLATLKTTHVRKKELKERKTIVVYKKKNDKAEIQNVIQTGIVSSTLSVTSFLVYRENSNNARLIARRKFENKNKTLMLIGVVFFFLICQLPTLILHLIESIDHQMDDYYYVLLLEIAKLLLKINLSFNFAIFYLFSKKFRESLKEMICTKRKNNDTSKRTYQALSIV